MGLDGNAFPYGDYWVSGRCVDSSVNSLQPSGSYDECEGGFTGLFDMSGNVHEFVGTVHDGRSYIYGGSYKNGETWLCCWCADDYGMSTAQENVGFRCCLTP